MVAPAQPLNECLKTEAKVISELSAVVALLLVIVAVMLIRSPGIGAVGLTSTETTFPWAPDEEHSFHEKEIAPNVEAASVSMMRGGGE